MKFPSEPSQRHPSAPALGSKKQPSEIEPPKEPFINLTNTGPVDPARFQRFIVPMEFIEKANELDLSLLGNDEQPLLPDTRADSHEPMTPPMATLLPEQATTQVVARRPVSALSRWRLSGRMPTSLKIVAIAVVALACFSIWFLSHLESRRDAPTIADVQGAALVKQSPSLAPPLVNEISPAVGIANPIVRLEQPPVESIASAAVLDIDSTEEPPTRPRQRAKSTASAPDKNSSRSENPVASASHQTTQPSISSAPNIKGVLPVFQPE